MKTKGTEKLEGKASGDKKAGKTAGKKNLRAIHARRLNDGSFHVEHHLEDGNLLEYSAASRQDLLDHMEEHLPEDAQAEQAGEGEGAAEPAAPQPQQGQPAEE